jgi:hypothetical protein
MSGGTKCPEGQNVRQTKHPWGQNVRRHNIRGTKHPWRENVRRDKTSGDKMSIWVIFLRFMLGNIFTEKSINVKEKSIKTMPLSLSGLGGNPRKLHHCQIIKNIQQRSFIFSKTVNIPTITLVRYTVLSE